MHEVTHNASNSRHSYSERRTVSSPAAAAGPYADPTHVVRQGIVIQASMGTLSAVEFLKQHGIHGAVIHRVLTGEQVRADDQPAAAPTAP